MHIGVILSKPSVPIITKNVINPPILSWTETSPPANKYNLQCGDRQPWPAPWDTLLVSQAHWILLVHMSSSLGPPWLLFQRFHPSFSPIGGQINITKWTWSGNGPIPEDNLMHDQKNNRSMKYKLCAPLIVQGSENLIPDAHMLSSYAHLGNHIQHPLHYCRPTQWCAGPYLWPWGDQCHIIIHWLGRMR